MTTNEKAIESFLHGKPVMVVEYRSSKADRIKWRDKESRNIVEAPILRHNVEAGDGTPYSVNERVPDNFKETEYKAPFKKGEKVLLTFNSLEVIRGAFNFQGQLEQLAAK